MHAPRPHRVAPPLVRPFFSSPRACTLKISRYAPASLNFSALCSYTSGSYLTGKIAYTSLINRCLLFLSQEQGNYTWTFQARSTWIQIFLEPHFFYTNRPRMIERIHWSWVVSCGPTADTMKICGSKNIRIHLDGASKSLKQILQATRNKSKFRGEDKPHFKECSFIRYWNYPISSNLTSPLKKNIIRAKLASWKH